DHDGFLAFTRPLLAMGSGAASSALLATRGERLALAQYTAEVAEDAVGPSTIDSLMLVETDEHGNLVAYDRWDLEDEGAARAELDARYEAGEAAAVTRGRGAPTLLQAFRARDWEAVAAL